MKLIIRKSLCLGPVGPSQLLKFLVENSASRLEHFCNDNLEFCLFGKKMTLEVLKEEPYMIIKIDGRCIPLLPKVKRAILCKLKVRDGSKLFFKRKTILKFLSLTFYCFSY